MRSPIPLALGAALLVLGAAAPVLGPTAAHAQNPSADDILRSLTPTGGGSTTRGIRVVQPGTGVPPAAAGARTGHNRARPQAATEANAPSVSLTVDFETNSAVLDPDAVHTLDHLGQALASPTLAGDRFRIEGHTDTVGDAAANRALSQRRADAVADYLATTFHIDRARLEPVGVGENGLLVRTGPGVDEKRNRRVAVINLG